MKFYNSFKNLDGSFTTYEFSESEMGNYNVIMLFIGIIAVLLISIVISPILLLVCIFGFYDDGPKASVIGLIISIYYMLDMINHWFIASFLPFLIGDFWFKSCLVFNYGYIACHLFTIIFGATFVYNFPPDKDKKEILYHLLTANIFIFIVFTAIAACFNPIR